MPMGAVKAMETFEENPDIDVAVSCMDLEDSGGTSLMDKVTSILGSLGDSAHPKLILAQQELHKDTTVPG